MLAWIGARLVEDITDRLEPEAEFAIAQDLGQPVGVYLGVRAVSGPCAATGTEQPDPVVVMQRPNRDPGQAGQLSDGEAAGGLLLLLAHDSDAKP